MLLNFIKAIIIGICASAPLGPIGVLCIQKTLSKGRWSGFSIGIGAAISDTFSAAIALFSLSFVDDFISRNRAWVLLIGGIIVCIVGLRIAMKNPIKYRNAGNNGQTPSYNHIGEIFQGLLLTASNPGALVLMLGIFALVGLNVETTGHSAPFVIGIMLLGVLAGALLWWLFLSWIINLFRKRFRLKVLIMINRISGFIIAGLGAVSIFQGVAEVLLR
jgi:Putative threonine efflux protein